MRVSDLVEQVKCEARLEALLGSERVVDERVRLVVELSEVVLGARRRLPREPRGRLLLSVPVAGVVAGVPIVGRPRAVLVVDGRVEAVVYSSVSSSPSRFYETDRVRAHAFCAALVSSPLPRGEAPVYLHLKAVGRGALAEGLRVLRGVLLEGGGVVAGGEGWAVHRVVCSEASVELLEPLLAYWLGARPPRVRRGPWCGDCPLRGACPYSGSA